MARAVRDPNKEIVPDKVLLGLSNKITGEWRNVARNLNLSEAEIYRIFRDNVQCTQEQIYQVFRLWKQKQGQNATYRILLEALENASRKDLADNLRSHQGSLSPDYGKEHKVTDSTHAEPGNRDRVDNEDSSNKKSKKGKFNSMFLFIITVPLLGFIYLQFCPEPTSGKDTSHTQSYRQNEKPTENSLEWFKATNEDSLTIGGVMIKPNQMVHLSLRKSNEGVLINSFNPHSPDEEYWQHIENRVDSGVPIVMSRRAIFYEDTSHVLFAAGNKVFIIHLQLSSNLYTSVDSVSVLTMDVVDPGSWINSIFGHQPTADPCDEFLVTVSYSTKLFVYSALGQIKQIFETKDAGSLHNHLSRVAFCERNFAIVDSFPGDIILMSVEGKVKQFSSLKPPISGFIPLDVICTGVRWLILYVSNDNEQNWMVATYKTKHNEDFKINDRGTFGPNLNRPVSITHSQKNGYVTFANGTVRHFRFGTWKTNSTVDDKLT